MDLLNNKLLQKTPWEDEQVSDQNTIAQLLKGLVMENTMQFSYRLSVTPAL